LCRRCENLGKESGQFFLEFRFRRISAYEYIEVKLDRAPPSDDYAVQLRVVGTRPRAAAVLTFRHFPRCLVGLGYLAHQTVEEKNRG
jgi:hypothetical protein